MIEKVIPSILFVLLAISISAQTYLDIDIEAARDTIEANLENPNFTILDVRTPAEYLPEHIEGAFNRDFYDTDFELQLDSLDKSRIYLIYCRSGNRSGQTLTMMENLGFETVYNMLGGMTAWNDANYPVTDVIPAFVDIYKITSSLVSQNQLVISTFPNPVTDVLSVNFQAMQLMNLNYKFLTTTGKIITEGKLDSAGVIDVTQLSKGKYTLSLSRDQTIIYSTHIIKL